MNPLENKYEYIKSSEFNIEKFLLSFVPAGFATFKNEDKVVLVEDTLESFWLDGKSVAADRKDTGNRSEIIIPIAKAKEEKPIMIYLF